MRTHIVFEIKAPGYIATAESAEAAAELIYKQINKELPDKTAKQLDDLVERGSKVETADRHFTVETPDVSFTVVSALREGTTMLERRLN